MPVVNKLKLGTEEYLEGEIFADVRHEYIAGDVYAMAGATERHNRIAGNLFFQLRSSARGSDCGVFVSDMKLRTGEDNSFDTCFYYPDVMLSCNNDDDHPLYKTSPCLISEVLSPSTENVDRREKLLVYKNMPNLRYYILVSSMQELIEYYQKNEQGDWDKYTLGKNDVLNIHCDDYHASLSFDDIYEDVRWD